MRRLWFILLMFFCPVAWAATPCEDGLNCYCDCVENDYEDGEINTENDTGGYANTDCENQGVLLDANVLMCEDFEAVTLTGNVADLDAYCTANPTECPLDDRCETGCTNMGGQDIHGPWYAGTGGNERGKANYWQQEIAPSGVANGDFCCIDYPDPCTGGENIPTYGEECTFSCAGGCGPAEWSAGDGTDPNSWDAYPESFVSIDIVRDGEFDDEISGITPNATHDSGQEGGGLQAFGQRVPVGGNGGIQGIYEWTPVTELGITMALAFSSNVATAGTARGSNSVFHNAVNEETKSAWKFDEWGSNRDLWVLGNIGAGPPPSAWGGSDSAIPYRPTLNFQSGSYTKAECWDIITAGNLPKGTGDFWTVHPQAGTGQTGCNTHQFQIGAEQGIYHQPDDFPYGTWACVRGYINNFRGPGMAIKIWHNDTLVYDNTGFDGTFLSMDTLDSYEFNAYYNPGSPHDEVFYKYEDNIHITEGEPVSCEQIGFAAAAAADPSMGIGLPTGGGLSRFPDILHWLAAAYLPGQGAM